MFTLRYPRAASWAALWKAGACLDMELQERAGEAAVTAAVSEHTPGQRTAELTLLSEMLMEPAARSWPAYGPQAGLERSE